MQVSSFQDSAELVQGLTEAWNSGDSTSFASYFAEDGDVVNIFGMRLRGKSAIAGVYAMLFRSVFHRSRLTSALSGLRQLCDGAALLHMTVGVHVPFGAMAGQHDTMCSLVLQRNGAGWRVASMHNTLISTGDGSGIVGLPRAT